MNVSFRQNFTSWSVPFWFVILTEHSTAMCMLYYCLLTKKISRYKIKMNVFGRCWSGTFRVFLRTSFLFKTASLSLELKASYYWSIRSQLARTGSRSYMTEICRCVPAFSFFLYLTSFIIVAIASIIITKKIIISLNDVQYHDSNGKN